MVDDTAKAERDKANGKTGGNPNIVKYLHQGRGRPGVNPQVKGRLKLTNLYPLQEEESPELSGLGSGEVVPFDAEAPFGRGAA
jgi:hypothetical protein